ncbi:MAG: hypothetical protein KAS12_00485 [Candidatus Aenigmarchaeota archaeon]|nr:hypothetical protein [Candidatus Aenigmarchaeota archaeon]
MDNEQVQGEQPQEQQAVQPKVKKGSIFSKGLFWIIVIIVILILITLLNKKAPLDSEIEADVLPNEAVPTVPAE